MASLVVPYYATKQRIVDAYEWMENDQDVEVDTLKVSLLCAISKSLIQSPARSTSCMHLQCFDLDTFLASNASREKPKCPICNAEIQASKLAVDEYFQSVLAVAAEESVSEVELLRDGRFRFPKAVVPFAVSSVAAEVISLSDDETEKEHVVDAKTVSSMAVKTKTAASDAPSRRWCILCEICRKACRNEAELSKHRAQAHVPQVASFTCNVCDERFYSEAARINHEDTLHGEKTFKCDLCDKSFRMRTARSMHMRCCARKKKAICDKCGQRFANQTAVAHHARVQHKKKKTLEEKERQWAKRYPAAKQKLSTTQGATAALEPMDLVERASREVETAAATSTSAPPPPKQRRLGWNSPPHGHYSTPTAFSVQPNTMQSTFPPIFPAYPSHPVPVFSPMTPPLQPFSGLYYAPPYQRGPIPQFLPSYYP